MTQLIFEDAAILDLEGLLNWVIKVQYDSVFVLCMADLILLTMIVSVMKLLKSYVIFRITDYS